MTPPPEAQDEEDETSMRWFLFGLSGRISRVPFVLATLLQTAVLGISVSRLTQLPEDSSAFGLWALVFLISMAASIWVTIATAIKRLHDINIPGAVVLCLFVPAVSIIAFLVLCFWPGTNGPNDYGDDDNRPKT
ncbi:MAG: DUF805 domain-containing protein [Pseudomonadota bacterium]